MPVIVTSGIDAEADVKEACRLGVLVYIVKPLTVEKWWPVIQEMKKLYIGLGEGSLKSSTMLKKINATRYDEVPAQMRRWNKAAGRILKGLECRREAEAALYQMRWS
jgi:GH24 family phage-related lysozyme (muramidase)